MAIPIRIPKEFPRQSLRTQRSQRKLGTKQPSPQKTRSDRITQNYNLPTLRNINASLKTQLNKSQNYLSLWEPSKLAIVGPKNWNIVESQDKDLKIDIMNMKEALKEEINKLLKNHMKT